MKKSAIAVLISLGLTATPIVAFAADYIGPLGFSGVTTYAGGGERYTLNTTVLHFYGVQWLDNGDTSQYPSADMVYGCGSLDGQYNYSWEQVGDFTSSDWGHYWYNVPSGEAMQQDYVLNGYYNVNTATPGPSTSGNYYVANS